MIEADATLIFGCGGGVGGWGRHTMHKGSEHIKITLGLDDFPKMTFLKYRYFPIFDYIL